VQTRAELDGDEFVINGQKVWASSAHLANWIFVLCRTDPDAPKHKGISFVLCPMDQRGVEVRPIRMLTGHSEFNEVFFDNARTARDNVVGGVNNGWTVAMTLLGYGRAETFATFPRRFRKELDRLVALIRRLGRSDDPIVRQRLASCYSRVEIMRYLSGRAVHRYVAGNEPGAEAALFKLYWSEYHTTVSELAVDVLDAVALVPSGKRPNYPFIAEPPGAPDDTASWVGVFQHARAGTIYAGSSQIQRNILGEHVLGLPREPRA
jgi:alkylation response protein AidB-like acyl-CoA dehydrogenase